MAGALKKSLTVFAIVVLIGAALFLSRRASEHRSPPSTADVAPATAPARGGELVTSNRAEPPTYNRYVDLSAPGEVLALLTQAPLVHVNRATDTLEPWLAESWIESPDHLTYTFKLRPGVTFSDGVPFTSADVLFSYRALYDPKVKSVLAGDTLIGGKPFQVEAPDPSTVVLHLPAPFAPGLRLIVGIPILPRHKLEPALVAGTFQEAWSAKTPLTEIAGLGPFVLAEHVSGQRLVFTRNPHYWRKDAAGIGLPYLDKLTMVVANQTTEALRMQAGEIDLMTNADIRPEDYAAFKRIADQGRLRLIDDGVGLDPNLLWFNLERARERSPERLAPAEGIQAGGVVRGRSAGDRQHGLPRRGDSDLRTGHTSQSHLVHRRAPFLRARPDEGARAVRLSWTLGSQRRRDARRCDGSDGEVFNPHAGGSHQGTRGGGPPGTAPAGGHGGGRRPGRSGRALSAIHAGQLRQHLFRDPGERNGSRGESRILAQLRKFSFLEPGTENAGHGLGAEDGRADAGPGHVARS